MALKSYRPLGILLALALVMAATRTHHFGPLPDASLSIFFLAGFWLRGQARWALPLLMAEAVLVDYLVITGQGVDFFSHYCVSGAYWFLIPSYAALWLGGSWLAGHRNGARLSTLGRAAAALLVSEAAYYTLSNGSFYWISANVPQRSFAGWMANYADWYLPYLTTTAIYAVVGAVLHVVISQLARTLGHSQPRQLHH